MDYSSAENEEAKLRDYFEGQGLKKQKQSKLQHLEIAPTPVNLNQQLSI